MPLRILIGGVYRGVYYNVGELARLPKDVAKQLIARKLAESRVSPVLAPLKRSARGERKEAE